MVGVLFGFFLVELLHFFVLPNHLWACYAIVASVYAAGGIGLFYAARAKFDQVHLVPPQTAESLRQDVQAVTGAVSAPQGGQLVHRS